MPKLPREVIISLINDGWKPQKKIRKGKYKYCYLQKNGQREQYVGYWVDEYFEIWLERSRDPNPNNIDGKLPVEKLGSSTVHDKMGNRSSQVINLPLETTKKLPGELSEKQELLGTDDHNENNEDNSDAAVATVIVAAIIVLPFVVYGAGSIICNFLKDKK